VELLQTVVFTGTECNGEGCAYKAQLTSCSGEYCVKERRMKADEVQNLYREWLNGVISGILHRKLSWYFK
jgi:DnaJ-class molecular chaperone